MPIGSPFKVGPQYLAATATNVYASSAGTLDFLQHIHLENINTSAEVVSLYISTTGDGSDGKQILGAYSLAAAGTAAAEKDIYFYGEGLRIIGNTDFLVGKAADASKVVITVIGRRLVIN